MDCARAFVGFWIVWGCSVACQALRYTGPNKSQSPESTGEEGTFESTATKGTAKVIGTSRREGSTAAIFGDGR
jgi:hypothetical protein